MTADGRRVFVMNQGDGTVSVINAQTNDLDVAPTGSTNPIVVGTQPVWADFAPVRNELVVANAGDGTNPGTVSIVNIPLCSAVTLPSNPGCDVNNPVDAVGFGQVLATVPVGVNSLMVAVLQDVPNSRAYVLNQHDSTVSVSQPHHQYGDDHHPRSGFAAPDLHRRYQRHSHRQGLCHLA